MHRLAEQNLKFERLVVSSDLAKAMFQDNQYKSQQVVGLAIIFWGLKVPCHESVYFRNDFYTLILPLKTHFRNLKSKKNFEKKVKNFGALARTSYVKEMAVAGLKIDFWTF